MSSPEVDSIIAMCKSDIELAPAIREYWVKYDALTENDTRGRDSMVPKNYPAFSRLAIIYEKRKDYQSALDVCRQAVTLGFTSDGTEGGMVGRAARLTRKQSQLHSVKLESPITITEDTGNGIVTTSHEIEAYTVIKTMLRDMIDAGRLSYKDTRTYFSVILDAKPTKWICRLNLESKNRSITIPDENGNAIRYSIETTDDIFTYKDQLLARIQTIK